MHEDSLENLLCVCVCVCELNVCIVYNLLVGVVYICVSRCMWKLVFGKQHVSGSVTKMEKAQKAEV